ncbi:MAG: hypothetical protein SF052_04945 [Bacteroidia bacterium]|nr:hypothetical protein [Bacteroidia bacterium]
MKNLLIVMAWELKLQIRYHIVTIAALVTAIYAAVFYFLPLKEYEKLLITLIFSDPAMLGFLFVGVLVLFEKGANTLKALVVTPLKPDTYLWAKAFSLTLIAIPAGLIMAITGYGWFFNYGWLLLGIIYASFLALFVGFIGVFRIRTLNQYLMIIPFFLTPLTFPLLNLFNVTDTLLFYLIPTQASLLLFEAAFNGFSHVGEQIYAIFYPLLWIGILFFLSKKSFIKYS